MFLMKSKVLLFLMVLTTLMASLIGCSSDSDTTADTSTETSASTADAPNSPDDDPMVEAPVDSKYFNIPWDLTTRDFKANNPDIRFGQDNGNDASTKEYAVEFFDTGIEGTFSAFFIDEKLIVIKAYIDDLMVDEPHPTMIAELESFFGETQYGSDNSSAFMFWENDETKITIFTESTSAHMVNMMYYEKITDS